MSMRYYLFFLILISNFVIVANGQTPENNSEVTFLNKSSSKEIKPNESGHELIFDRLKFIELQHELTDIFNFVGLFVAILGGVGIPILLYRRKEYQTKKDLLIRTSQSMLREIEHNELAITGQSGYTIIERNIDGNTTGIKFTNAFLDTDSYDSVISSGHFIQFQVETQGLLREFYTRIKDHNSTIVYSNHLEDQLKRDLENDKKVPLETLARYDVFLTRTEKELLELAPKIKKVLNTEIGRF